MYLKKETDYLMRIVVYLAREYSKGMNGISVKNICFETGVVRAKAQRLCSELETFNYCVCETQGQTNQIVIVKPDLLEAEINDVLKITHDDINIFMLFDKGNKQWAKNAELFRGMEEKLRKVCTSVKVQDIISYENDLKQ